MADTTGKATSGSRQHRRVKVFVVGGMGAIGGHAVPALVRAGHGHRGRREHPIRPPGCASRALRPSRCPSSIGSPDRGVRRSRRDHQHRDRDPDNLEVHADQGMGRQRPCSKGRLGRRRRRRDHRSTSLTGSLRVSNARFRGASGWTPMYPGAHEGWIATAEALQDS